MTKLTESAIEQSDIHHRRSIRLKNYDYSQAGLYFVTIACNERKCRFGNIENGEMVMNEYGEIAHHQWINLTKRFTQIEIDIFQVMPNHIHGIIVILLPENDYLDAPIDRIPLEKFVGAPLAGAQSTASTRITLGDIIGTYKSLVTKDCLNIYKSNHQEMGKLWQRNYWERIIRNEQELSDIRHYIENNPLQWEFDSLNTERGHESDL